MRPHALITLAFGLSSLLAAPLALAQSERYRFDPVHSQVLFFVDHLGFSRSMGRFTGLSGGFRYDPEDWSTASVEATIDVRSLWLGDAAWEKKMLSDDFFDAERFPEMRFVGDRLESTGAGRGRLHGTLTLLGVSRPVTIELVANRIGRHTYSMQYVAGFSATATLRRSDFGMRRLLPAVGDEVTIRLEVEGVRERGGE